LVIIIMLDNIYYLLNFAPIRQTKYINYYQVSFFNMLSLYVTINITKFYRH